ncbi:dethiobiotin synthase [Teredinibacter waterburyi]|uniref:dethiobiotin synthase n=1 Tax=Teredinibacter waterburyi TaxID=1500538 RepID=UPI00165F3B44|nr:dethiobiotin synthase [Teredinibacter waterburyi]
MTSRFFVTGTDTDVGKTFISCALLKKAKLMGLNTLALKPVAAGCELTEHGLRNDDAVRLQAAATIKIGYEQVNPVALKAAVAPHLAAQAEQRSLQLQRLVGFCRGAMSPAPKQPRCDLCLIEGAGGWRVPLNATHTMAHLAVALQLPVIVVVAVKLGCLNHALLTVEAIRRDGLQVAGWVANLIDSEMPELEGNLTTLEQQLGAPCLGRVFELTGSDDANLAQAASCLDLTLLGLAAADKAS